MTQTKKGKKMKTKELIFEGVKLVATSILMCLLLYSFVVVMFLL